MEHLWSPAGATGGKRLQRHALQSRSIRPDPHPVATHGKRFGAHGKEGVDGSSPSEGFAEISAKIEQLSCLFRKRLSRAGIRGHYLKFPR
jgi:hypothetical protein